MRQMMKPVMAGVMAALVVTTGCFRQETLHSIYIGPGGAVRWMIAEKDVRSVESGEEARRSEEAQWLAQARSGDHPATEALRALGPSSLTWLVVRDTRPFMVVTEAEVGRIDELGRVFLEQLRLDGQSELDTDGSRIRWTLTVLKPDVEPESAHDSPVIDLLADESYRIILEEGRFVDAVGFELSEGSTVALPVEQAEFPKDGSPLVFSLTWGIGDELDGDR